MAFNFLDVPEDNPAQRLFSNLIKDCRDGSENQEVHTDQLDPLSQLLPQAPMPQPSLAITPQPGFCVKTQEISGEKVFLNLCHCDQIPAPEHKSEEELQALLEMEEVNYRVPISIGPLHREMDKEGNPCQAYDVVVNSGFFHNYVAKSKLFSTFVANMALQGLEEKYQLTFKEDIGWIQLKNKKYFGTQTQHFIQDRSQSASAKSEPMRSRPLIEDITDIKQLNPPSPRKLEERQGREVPAYKVFLFPATGHPTHLKYLVELPRIDQISHLVLEVSATRVLLSSFSYRLDLQTRHLVMSDRAQALFHPSSHILQITLPIISPSKSP